MKHASPRSQRWFCCEYDLMSVRGTFAIDDSPVAWLAGDGDELLRGVSFDDKRLRRPGRRIESGEQDLIPIRMPRNVGMLSHSGVEHVPFVRLIDIHRNDRNGVPFVLRETCLEGQRLAVARPSETFLDGLVW